MTNEVNNIVKQAKNGSVAAIIQVLNEKLADSGVRTRAIFADGVLQLLCEAPTLDQLDQPILVERIRSILEGIAPRNIRRININSRIVREQQLLWLDEINRDREKQVLWSEEITLKKPGFWKQFSESWSDQRSEHAKTELAKAVASRKTRKQREQRQFWLGLGGGAIVSGLLLAVGWFFYPRFAGQVESTTPTPSSPAATSPTQSTASTSNPPASSQATATPRSDAFADAVRLAERTSQASRSAKTTAEWLSLATQWQQASDLMSQVDASDSRYETARSRVEAYRQNSDIALKRAQESGLATPDSSAE